MISYDYDVNVNYFSFFAYFVLSPRREVCGEEGVCESTMFVLCSPSLI